MRRDLTENDLKTLRELNLVREHEVPFWNDNELLVECLPTRGLRILNVDNIVLETKRTVLKG